MCYVYDAKGMRIRQTLPSGSEEFVRDLQGNVVSDVLINFGWSRGYVDLESQFLAQYGDGTTYFVHADHLGSTRLMTKVNQSIADSYDYVPYGEGLNGGTLSTHRFTGYERDGATGKDYARARYYAAPAASFLTPDPAGTSATCLLNPQTQNRYAYVTDNPVNLTDPTGLCGDGDNSDCGGFGISIPLFPTGGGGGEAPPTPHPVLLALPDLPANGRDKSTCTCDLVFDGTKVSHCSYACVCEHTNPGFLPSAGGQDWDLKDLRKKCGRGGFLLRACPSKITTEATTTCVFGSCWGGQPRINDCTQ
jgi:RHS repeat-associated protein